jgi:hypothetical protein
MSLIRQTIGRDGRTDRRTDNLDWAKKKFDFSKKMNPYNAKEV